MLRLCLIALALSAVGGAHAADLQLKLSGTNFEGGPGYRVLVGEEVVSSGRIVAFSPNAQLVSVTVPDAELTANLPIVVRMTDDKYEKDVGDRNLFVISATIDKREIPLDAMTLERDGVAQPPNGRGRHLAINRESASVLIPRTPFELSVAAPITPAPAERPQLASAPPVLVLPAEAVYAPVVPRFVGPAPLCDATAIVGGFGNNDLEIPAGLAALEKVIAQAKTGRCAIAVTGYGSLSGSPAANQRISAQRAQLALDYLAGQGLRFSSETVTGGGGTDRFGPTPADNRVVTIELRPALIPSP